MGERLTLSPTALPGVVVAESAPIADPRGHFARLFCEDELRPVLDGARIVQANISCTQRATTIRGLHFQRAPHAEAKLVRCIRGAAFDVAVDLRAGSPTFAKWHAEALTAANWRMLMIPPGCAHGFQALEDDTELLYLHTAAYAPESEGGVAYDDPTLGIAWPLRLASDDLVSARDRALPRLDAWFGGLRP